MSKVKIKDNRWDEKRVAAVHKTVIAAEHKTVIGLYNGI